MTPSASCMVAPVSSSIAEVISDHTSRPSLSLRIARGGHPLEAELGDGVRLVALERHPAGVRPEGDQVGTETERRLGGVLVAEPAGVGEQRRIEVGGRLLGDGAAHGRSSRWTTWPVALAAGSTRLISPNPSLLRVMVDIDHVGDVLHQPGSVAEAVHGRAVEGEEEVEGRRLFDDRVEAGEVGERSRQRAGQTTCARLPISRSASAKARAEPRLSASASLWARHPISPAWSIGEPPDLGGGVVDPARSGPRRRSRASPRRGGRARGARR